MRCLNTLNSCGWEYGSTFIPLPPQRFPQVLFDVTSPLDKVGHDRGLSSSSDFPSPFPFFFLPLLLCPFDLDACVVSCPSPKRGFLVEDNAPTLVEEDLLAKVFCSLDDLADNFFVERVK
jgi:hypothetical protein